MTSRRLRQRVGHHCFARRPDRVRRPARSPAAPWACAGSDDDCVGRSARERSPSTATRPGAVKRAVPLMTVTLCFLQQPGHASIELLGDRARARNDAGRSTFAGPISMPSAAAPSMSRSTSAVCSSAFVGMQPQFRQTPPSLGAFDQRRCQAELRGADRGDVAAGSAADDDDVEDSARSSIRPATGTALRADRAPCRGTAPPVRRRARGDPTSTTAASPCA